MPDGTHRKKLDTTKINNLGWQARINLEKGMYHCWVCGIKGRNVVKVARMASPTAAELPIFKTWVKPLRKRDLDSDVSVP